MDQEKIKLIVQLALAEDIGSGDLTAALVPAHMQSQAYIVSQQEAVICGTEFVTEVFRQLDATIKISWLVKDGATVTTGQKLCDLVGSARNLLSGERTALNFLQTLSSTATLTQKYVAKLQNSKTKLLDTRKTLPGLRLAQKYAVTCGGGKNHRIGLYDAVLIKENHIAACGSITQAINSARKLYSDKTIEIEVRNFVELQEALNVGVDIILLDNFTLDEIKHAVALVTGRAKLEVSGGVNLETIAVLATTGVDYISVGAITKTVIPIELSLLFE